MAPLEDIYVNVWRHENQLDLRLKQFQMSYSNVTTAGFSLSLFSTYFFSSFVQVCFCGLQFTFFLYTMRLEKMLEKCGCVEWGMSLYL